MIRMASRSRAASCVALRKLALWRIVWAKDVSVRLAPESRVLDKFFRRATCVSNYSRVKSPTSTLYTRPLRARKNRLFRKKSRFTWKHVRPTWSRLSCCGVGCWGKDFYSTESQSFAACAKRNATWKVRVEPARSRTGRRGLLDERQCWAQSTASRRRRPAVPSAGRGRRLWSEDYGLLS